jgi:hypothetical protein
MRPDAEEQPAAVQASGREGEIGALLRERLRGHGDGSSPPIPVEDDPEVATRTLVIAVGWSLLWRSRAGG